MFPTLARMLQEMADDNEMVLLPPDAWVWPDNAQALEDLALGLRPEQHVEFVCGSHQENQILLRLRPEFMHLDKFLEDAFDGALTENFFGDTGTLTT